MESITIADLNGPLGYWGPAAASADQPPRPAGVAPAVNREALAGLRQTLHGRTWTGTNALMSRLVEAATSGPAAAQPL